jgi:hypothetical protein
MTMDNTQDSQPPAIPPFAALAGYAAGAEFENRHSGRIAIVKRVERTGCVLAHPNGTFFYDFDNIERNWKPHNARISDGGPVASDCNRDVIPPFAASDC